MNLSFVLERVDVSGETKLIKMGIYLKLRISTHRGWTLSLLVRYLDAVSSHLYSAIATVQQHGYPLERYGKPFQIA